MISRPSRERANTLEDLEKKKGANFQQIRHVSPNITIREQDLIKNLQKAKKQFGRSSHSTSRDHRERSKSQPNLKLMTNQNRDLNQTQPLSTKKDLY